MADEGRGDAGRAAHRAEDDRGAVEQYRAEDGDERQRAEDDGDHQQPRAGAAPPLAVVVFVPAAGEPDEDAGLNEEDQEDQRHGQADVELRHRRRREDPLGELRGERIGNGQPRRGEELRRQEEKERGGRAESDE